MAPLRVQAGSSEDIQQVAAGYFLQDRVSRRKDGLFLQAVLQMRIGPRWLRLCCHKVLSSLVLGL